MERTEPMTLTSRSGVLWITFYHQSKRYRRSLKLEDTKKNRKFAHNNIIPELVYKLNSGTFFNTEKQKQEAKQRIPTVNEFAKTSFEIHKTQRRELTQKEYAQMFSNHIRPAFGNKRIDQIKASDIAKWQNRLLETRSPKTVKSIRTVFQTILEDAMIDELIKTNPFIRVKSPRGFDVREKKPFSKDEIFRIIENVPEKMRAFFAIGFFTGMRTGELIGLKWDDINWQDQTITVHRSRREGIETVPKTKNSIREVDILDALLPYLEAHRELANESSEYIFTTSKGQPFNTCSKIAAWYWKPTLKQCDIEYRNLYQMRHTFASLMISNGEDILWVAQMLGHKDASMTLEKYARYVKTKNKKRAQFLYE
ncbi:MAG: tyrosine-type recombinase/integrase [Candidatus Muiribacteriota bacterium]